MVDNVGFQFRELVRVLEYPTEVPGVPYAVMPALQSRGSSSPVLRS